MGWFRTRKVAVAWVALLALACQLVLSYGHVHSSLIGTGNYSFGDASCGSVAMALAADDGGQSATDPSAPPQKSPNRYSGFLRDLRKYRPRRYTVSAGGPRHCGANFVHSYIAVAIGGR